MIHVVYLVEGIGNYRHDRAAYETAEDALADLRSEGLMVEIVSRLFMDGCVARVGRDDYVTITPLRLFEAKTGEKVGDFPLSQRDAMRYAASVHADRDGAIRYWLNELEDGNVKLHGKAARDPEGYAERLYDDGMAKGWLHQTPRPMASHTVDL